MLFQNGHTINKGKILPLSVRLKISKSLKGRPNLALKGRKQSSEVIEAKRQRQLGKKYSEERKRKMSESQRKFNRLGDNHPNWKGGITPINQKIRKSLEYRLWREAVFRRDNWTCIWCGQKGNINADHIKQFSLYPELRFAIDNGRTLCVQCHKTTETYGRVKKLTPQPVAQPSA